MNHPVSDSKTSEILRAPSNVIVGIISGVVGLRGEVRVQPLTDFPERFTTTKELYAHHPSKGSILLHPLHARFTAKGITIKFCELTSSEESKEWVGAELSINKSELHVLEEGRYYVFQILGMMVYSDDGLFLGEVCDVLSPGANDVYVVSLSPQAKQLAVDSDGEKLLLPVIDEVILNTDLNLGRITVRLMDGLL